MKFIAFMRDVLLSSARIAEMFFLVLFFRKQEGEFLQVCEKETKITLLLVLLLPLILLGALAVFIEYAYVLKNWEK